VQRPVIRVLKYPHFEYALAGIEIRHRAENVEKDVLDHILGFRGVADNAHSNIENKQVVTVEEDSNRVVMADTGVSHQLFIRERA